MRDLRADLAAYQCQNPNCQSTRDHPWGYHHHHQSDGTTVTTYWLNDPNLPESNITETLRLIETARHRLGGYASGAALHGHEKENT